MRYFRIVSSDGKGNFWEETLSEKDVLDYYWPYYSNELEEMGVVPTKEECIEDWVVAHWAEEVDR